MEIIMENEDYVRNYIAHVNSELQAKVLEVCSLKAQLKLANEQVARLQHELSTPEPEVEETY
jgi:hypothetical protein